jgi:prepilin-type N-terminal cleavage/methylation domain-containing protein
MNTSHALRGRGFTLVEILIVIAIIGLLSAVVFASLSEARAKSRDNARVSDLKQIELALALYREANGDYPDTGNLGNTDGTGLIPAFLPRLPVDPRDGSAYIYTSGSSGYSLITILETGNSRACYVQGRGQTTAPATPSGVSEFFECGNF